MSSAVNLPRLVFGAGSLAELASELRLITVTRPLLISDRGLEAVGLVGAVIAATGSPTAVFTGVPENPTAAAVEEALAVYRAAACDGVIALGGGSVIDTAKVVAALAATRLDRAADLVGTFDAIGAVVPLVAIPTTVGTGSESSPAAAIHLDADGPAVGTRSPLLVPAVALCDPDLARSLPPRLVAATAIDALSHCIEGYFAEPPNPMVDALAIDGIARVFKDATAALEPHGDEARGSLMAAAFAGGVAIHKGLGPAHAVALTCEGRHIHHGTMIGVALPHTTTILARHLPDKAARACRALGLAPGADIGHGVYTLIVSLGLPTTLSAAGFQCDDPDALAAQMASSMFNRMSPYAFTAGEYREILAKIGM